MTDGVQMIFDPEATWKRKPVYNFRAKELMVPIYQGGKLVYERGHLMFTKLGVDEREFTFSSNQGFASIPCETVEIEIPEGHGEQHNGILKNFTNHILFGEELLAPGYEGINGLSIANAMVLSSETGKWVELPNDGEEFWALLQEKIKTSRNKEDAGIVFDTEGTYGNK